MIAFDRRNIDRAGAQVVHERGRQELRPRRKRRRQNGRSGTMAARPPRRSPDDHRAPLGAGVTEHLDFNFATSTSTQKTGVVWARLAGMRSVRAFEAGLMGGSERRGVAVAAMVARGRHSRNAETSLAVGSTTSAIATPSCGVNTRDGGRVPAGRTPITAPLPRERAADASATRWTAEGGLAAETTAPFRGDAS